MKRGKRQIDTAASHTHIVGDNNCSTTTLHQLSDSPYGAAELHGKLACISAELPSRALMNSETFKAFCGGDKITARRIYGSPFDYEPYATLIYACNEVPDSYDTTEGLYRKLLIVDFQIILMVAQIEMI